MVFSEFNHNKDHTYTPLPNKNIDTGMGLERMASIAQNVRTNYETDLFMPIINEVENVSGKNILKQILMMSHLKLSLTIFAQFHLQLLMARYLQMKEEVMCYADFYVVL